MLHHTALGCIILHQTASCCITYRAWLRPKPVWSLSLEHMHHIMHGWLPGFCLTSLVSSAFHCGPEQPRIQTEVLGHSLVHLLVRCAHSFARSLTSLTRSLVGKWLIRWLFYLWFFSIFDHSALDVPSLVKPLSNLCLGKSSQAENVFGRATSWPKRWKMTALLFAFEGHTYFVD